MVEVERVCFLVSPASVVAQVLEGDNIISVEEDEEDGAELCAAELDEVV